MDEWIKKYGIYIQWDIIKGNIKRTKKMKE